MSTWNSIGGEAEGDGWASAGHSTMGDRLRSEVGRTLTDHSPDPVDEKLATEIDHIVDAARRDLG